METFPNVIQPVFSEIFRSESPLKGKWNSEVFGNGAPIVLELGCGKGEYTVGLAQNDPGKNFIGVDIKGARMWTGARQALDLGLENVRFLRTRIEQIGAFFSGQEVAEIWLTFPDPQLKRRRNKKRLTAPSFLNEYRKFLVEGGKIHLKTDSAILYHDTVSLLRQNGIEPLLASEDLYGSGLTRQVPDIQTHYEKQFLQMGLRIHYLQFVPDIAGEIKEYTDGEGKQLFRKGI